VTDEFDFTADIAWDYYGKRYVIHVRYRPRKHGNRNYTRLTIAPEPGATFEQACEMILPTVVAEYQRRRT
jgi:hypothetical protein